MNSAELIKQLQKDGWVLRGVKGSHHVFSHPFQARPHQRTAPTQRFGGWIALVPTLQRGNAYPGAPAPRNRPLERPRRVSTPVLSFVEGLERGNQNTTLVRVNKRGIPPWAEADTTSTKPAARIS